MLADANLPYYLEVLDRLAGIGNSGIVPAGGPIPPQTLGSRLCNCGTLVLDTIHIDPPEVFIDP
jgi:hypothetical protein